MSRGDRLPFRAWRRFTKKTGDLGQAIVEMAFVLPIFVVLLFGIIDVGDALNSYITVIDVSRDGARLASKGQATDADLRNMAAVEMERLRDPFDPVNDMTIDRSNFDGDTAVKVSICSDHSLLTPAIGLFLDDPLRMCASTRMRTITFDD